jgi:FkbM family methyltransferase
VDVGAHVGYFTVLLAKQVGPSGEVVAFEPNPNIFEILKENVALNGYRNVILENKAVADQAGQVELRLSSRLPQEGIDSIISDPGPGPRIKVLAVRLDDYFGSGSNRVGFVKMDIEGAEALALEGMSRILAVHRPSLVIELHGADGCAEKHPAFSKLKEAGYEVSVLGVPDITAHILAEPKHTGGQS